MSKPFDYAAHRGEMRVSNHLTVYHPEAGQLCWYETDYDVIVYHPIQFREKYLAQQWIDNGHIGDIQEGLSILQVCFSNVMVQGRTVRYENVG
jgi:hypothetical protein